MFRPLSLSHRRPPRRGTAILITVFFLITIMMVMGLALVMYAARERAAALAYQDAVSGVTLSVEPPSPENTVNQFLSALIYDTPDDGDALTNSLRGHSIARAMYGSRYDFSTPVWSGALVPWAGVGVFHDTGNFGNATLNGQDRVKFVNHTLQTVGGAPALIDPEWTNVRAITNNSPVPAFSTTRADTGAYYIGKHAGYTYPDLKNYFLGARDPATGEVVVQSYHRSWLFGDLAPTNPMWTNAIGIMHTLRPRPAEHPNFPRVPPDADGVYRGDVQNLPGSYRYDQTLKRYISQNDSLWMHIGLPRITLSDGRIIQPMVAPLILPLDGQFDLSTQGNKLTSSSGHFSYHGHGPWEINAGYGLTDPGSTSTTVPLALAGALETNRQAILANRTPSRKAEFAPFTTDQQLPSYAPVAWAPGASTISFDLPTGNSLVGQPTFTGYKTDNAPVDGHPAGYNLNEFAASNDSNPNGPIFPYTDLKRLSLRHTFTPNWYDQAFITKVAPQAFKTDPSANFAYKHGPGAGTIPGAGEQAYRLDPAHARRLIFGPRYSGLDRPALTPTFVKRNDGTALRMATTDLKPQPLFPTGTATYPGPQTLGTLTDFASANLWVNVQAALGSVNLNRPLADYRGANTAAPLSESNVTNAAQADKDRRALAKDIFARLIVATGAAGQVTFDEVNGVQIALPNPATFQIGSDTTYTYTPEQYNALRYLAQLAVNIVDYIDNDDVSTIFQWNPGASLADDLKPENVGNHVVFGVEKPRLLLNEVYSEITNDPTTQPSDTAPLAGGNASVKFWAELVNATQKPYATGSGIFGTGAVKLYGYQIQIARVKGGAQEPAVYLKDPANTTGRLGTTTGGTAAPDATYTFPKMNLGKPEEVQPNDATASPGGQYAPSDITAGGFVLVGPPNPATAKTNAKEFTPTAGMWMSNKVESADPSDASNPSKMGYVIPLTADSADLSKAEYKRHVVLLQRLTNPYQDYNDQTNPYVTVDWMDYVPSFDAVHRVKGEKDDRNEWSATNTKGFDPVASRYSVGKVQPLAGRCLPVTDPVDGSAANRNYNTYEFNSPDVSRSSMVLAQVTEAPASNTANEPKHTFGRHNGKGTTQPAATVPSPPSNTPVTLADSETLMVPFDWLTHMDRPLETLGDVFFARDCKPHQLTQEFVVNTANGLVYNRESANWTQHNSGLARALELLTVKLPDQRIAHGGRVSGKINLNAIQDRRVVQGLWDPQPGNKFDLAFVNDTVWTQWMASRSALDSRTLANGSTTFTIPVPSGTVADRGSGDRPFLPFGAPVVEAPAGAFAYTAPSASQDGDTILRRLNNTSQPYLYSTTQTHVYTQSEPLRKVMNNVTTVSHGFIVYLTIGYFEYEGDPNPASWPTGVQRPARFGAEVFDRIPGDMRQKYVAVVDMSNMALQANPAANTDPHATVQPFFTALSETARAGGTTLKFPTWSVNGNTTLYVAADGIPVPIVKGDQLVVGYGAEKQIVIVDTVSRDATTGIGEVTVTTPLTRDAWGGTCVSNVRPGYAGPRTDFNVNSAKYKPVVPYIERLR